MTDAAHLLAVLDSIERDAAQEQARIVRLLSAQAYVPPRRRRQGGLWAWLRARVGRGG